MSVRLILVVALILTVISAVMNVSGYISLYSETIIIPSLFITLELTKSVIFGVIFVVGTLKHKIMLLSFSVVLILISFLGHLSFLSKAYNLNKTEQLNQVIIQETQKDTTSQLLENINSNIQLLNGQLSLKQNEINLINKNIQDYNKVESRNYLYNRNKPRLKELQTEIQNITAQLQTLFKEKQTIIEDNKKQTKVTTETNQEISNRSVFKFTAELFNISSDYLANIINFLLSLIIDPLALCLLFVSSQLLHKQQDEDNKGTQIDTDSQEQLVDNKQTDSINEQELEDWGGKVETITIYNCDNYKLKGHTIQEFVKLDVGTLNNIKSSIKSKQARDWFNSGMTIRNNRTLYKPTDKETRINIE